MKTLWHDVRYATRVLWKSPGFTLVAVIALALGIGANSALFSVVNGVLLRPLPLNEPESLARIYEENQGHDMLRQSASAPNFLDWRAQSRSFERMAGYLTRTVNFTGRGEPERVPVAAVLGDFFGVLRVAPTLGRDFVPDDFKQGGPNVVVLSDRTWRRRFNADPNAIGQAVTLNGQDYTVVGVMPREAQWPEGVEFWAPVNRLQNPGRRSQFLSVIARKRPEVTWGQAQAELGGIAGRLAQEYPDANKGWGASVVPLKDVIVGDIKPALLVLLGAVGFVLLIACANVANLLLARASARGKEVAIRMALGAGRWRIVRQLLTESLLLALAGGGLGLLLALWSTDALVALGPAVPRAGEIGVDGWVLGFTLLASVATGVAFGLLPALQSARADLNESLKEGGRSSGGADRRGARSALVVAEVALSLVLLVGAGLMLRSVRGLSAVAPGFDPQDVLTMELVLPTTRYAQPQQRAALFQQALQRIAALPGVQSAAGVANLPLESSGWSNSFAVEGRPPLAQGEFVAADNNRVTPWYFRTMRIPLVSGRDIGEQDTADAPKVVVISETMARRFFPGEEAIGKRITVHDGGPNPREIVGVVRDVKHDGLDADAKPMMYSPYLQDPAYNMVLTIRAQGDLGALAAAVRREVWAVDKELPVSKVRTMDELLANSLARSRFSLLLLSIFAGLALVLAAVGIYGVMSYTVSRRTHEIGVRIALGAQGGDVLRMVVRRGMALTMLGVALGLAASFALTRAMLSLLYGVSPTDPLTYAGVSLLLAAVALLACLVPARRAAKVDPMVALRYE